MTIITSPELTEECLQAMGDLREVAAGLEQMRRSGEVLSAEYPEKWIAIHDGNVAAAADTLDALLALVDEVDPASRDHVLVRFISRHPQRMIL